MVDLYPWLLSTEEDGYVWSFSESWKSTKQWWWWEQ